MDKDKGFAGIVTNILENEHLTATTYQGLLGTLSRIQSLLQVSTLSEEEKMAVWRPIAECYVSVQTTLKERILPLGERELIEVGKTVIVPVRISKNSSGEVDRLNTTLPKFQYALWKMSQDDPSYFYRVDRQVLYFSDQYIHSLPFEIQARMQEGVMKLPLKVSHAVHSESNYAEIDEEAFWAMYGEDASDAQAL